MIRTRHARMIKIDQFFSSKRLPKVKLRIYSSPLEQEDRITITVFMVGGNNAFSEGVMGLPTTDLQKRWKNHYFCRQCNHKRTCWIWGKLGISQSGQTLSIFELTQPKSSIIKKLSILAPLFYQKTASWLPHMSTCFALFILSFDSH